MNPFCADNAFIFKMYDKNLKCEKLVRITIVLCVEFRSVANSVAYWFGRLVLMSVHLDRSSIRTSNLLSKCIVWIASSYRTGTQTLYFAVSSSFYTKLQWSGSSLLKSILFHLTFIRVLHSIRVVITQLILVKVQRHWWKVLDRRTGCFRCGCWYWHSRSDEWLVCGVRF